MRLIVARHGNTFNSSEEAVMLGRNQNIPLVETGRQQARALANYLIDNNLSPKVIFTNHLLRCFETAVIIRERFLNDQQCSIPMYLNDSLIEIDYGSWASLKTGNDLALNQVALRFGRDTWNNWQNLRQFPPKHLGNWNDTESKVKDNINSFVNMLCESFDENDTVLAISSQGTMFFLNSLLEGGVGAALKQNRTRVSTGGVCSFEVNIKSKKIDLVDWNKSIA